MQPGIEYSDEDGCFIGHIAGIKDIIGFHAESVKELRAAFEDAVNDYLATCERCGRTPQRPYSGNLMLRVPPEVHARAAMMAEAHGMSLNQWAAEVLSRASGKNQSLVRHPLSIGAKRSGHVNKKKSSQALHPTVSDKDRQAAIHLIEFDVGETDIRLKK